MVEVWELVNVCEVGRKHQFEAFRGVKKLRILNLFAGVGGNRTLWENVEVVAVELIPRVAAIYQKRFPNDIVLVQDAFSYLLNSELDFDLIWSSPPCQTHSKMQLVRPGIRPIPQLQEIYGLKIWLDRWWCKGHYIIENVQPYYSELIPCTVRLDRHLIWSTFHIEPSRQRFSPRQKRGFENSRLIKAQKAVLIAANMLEDVQDVVTWSDVRNCVNPKIGKYILDQFRCLKVQQLLVM